MAKTKTKRYTTSFSGDLLEMATVTRWLVLNGYNPRSRNEVLNLAVQHLASIIKEQMPEAVVVSVDDAEQWLESAGLGSIKRKRAVSLKAELKLPAQVSASVEAKTAASNRGAMAVPGAESLSKILKHAKEVEKQDRAVLRGLGSVPNVTDSSPVVETSKH